MSAAARQGAPANRVTATEGRQIEDARGEFVKLGSSGRTAAKRMKVMKVAKKNTPGLLRPSSQRLTAMVITAVLTQFLVGCAVRPRALSETAQANQVSQDRDAMFRDQEPIAKPISMSEAMARAIRYNLEQRQRLMEEALSQHQLSLANWSLLPAITASAGYIAHDTDQASSSRAIATGQQSLVPSTSEDRVRRTGDLGVTWNVLDFGVSYFQAQQQSDRTLIMKERRRKVVQNLMQQVREAYWFALGAQSLEGKIEPLLKQVQDALENSHQIESERLSSPSEALNYRRQLLINLRQLEGVRDELARGKPRLAALINIEPGRSFELVAPDTMEEPEMKENLDAMERAALLRRPELVEARYSERIGVLDTKIALAKILPGVEFDIGSHYDSNSFLVNNFWNDAGLRVTWNLMNGLSYRQSRATAQAGVDVTRAQRLALNMAVLTQVHVAYRDYQGRKRQFELTQMLAQVDHSLFTHSLNASQNDAQGRLTSINAAVQSLFSDFRSYQDYGSLQNAYGLMLATLGSDPLPDQVSGIDIATLARSIEENEKKDLAL
jgi:outer membrane protein TolC